MVRVITQETFDEAVRENMEEFSMEFAEAVKEAKEQFESQGVSLANIVVSEKGSQIVVDAVKSLFRDLKEEELLSQLASIQNCCESDLAQRVLATDSGAYSVLLRLCKDGNFKIQCEVLATLTKVMDTNPDHLEQQGLELIYSLLSSTETCVVSSTLDWLLICCVRHEGNRQSFVDRPGLLNKLSEIAKGEDTIIMIRVFRVWVQLCQDDDIRVPFGKAHEHAREIVENHGALTIITRAMVKHRQEKDLVSCCLMALASLSLRNEYCQEVTDEGGLGVVTGILSSQREDVELVTRAIILLKVLAGNDKVKTEVGKGGGIPLLLAAIQQHLPRAPTMEAGCNALAVLCLRQSDNCKQVVLECEGATVLTAIMERHPKHRKTQGAAAAAIRNIVSRNRELCTAFLDRGVGDLLNTALSIHGDHIGDTLRSAQRDLGLHVELQERWVGEKIKIAETFQETEGAHH